jgi:hypothetical protein
MLKGAGSETLCFLNMENVRHMCYPIQNTCVLTV